MKKIKLYINLSLIYLLLGAGTLLSAQSDASKVSIIGEDDEAYEKLISSCPDMMLNVADNSMDKAFQVWVAMLEDVQKAAEKENFPINGIKLWMNTFWNPDGTIKELVYYPKPTSRNIDYDELTAFLERFVADYALPLSYERCFSHYGSAAFPVSMNVAGANTNSGK